MDLSFHEQPIEGAPWAFIAVMGVTGSGKSTFIQWASRNNDIVIGHDLNSCNDASNERKKKSLSARS
jgi:predicted kinase